MEFEWHSGKAARNRTAHGVSFEQAVTAFYDSLATTFPDRGHSLGEARFITLGYSANDRLQVAPHVEVGEISPIIGARAATAREGNRHEAQNPRGKRRPSP